MNTESETSEETTKSKGVDIFLRIRPSINPSGYIFHDDIDENQLVFKVPQEDRGIVNNSRTNYAFNFNRILDENTNQDQVFKAIGIPAVNNVFQGYNSTVFAYGQTGSGKTFTMTGGPERYADRGIIPRAISLLFSKFQEESSNGVSFSCFVSYLELYNEHGFDLLAASGENEMHRLVDMPRVTMLEDEEGNYHFRNLSVNPVSSEEDALNLLFIGDTNRAIGETEMNQSSSRSHCIFSIMIEKRVVGSDSVIRSKLNLVDLAGSERVGKTNSSGQTLKEAQYINTSLFFLEMVIVALHERTKKGKENTHIPYRNSMMTSVLRDSLGGNCVTMMIATISPEAKQTDESISTCQFAKRVALIKNVAYINEDLEPELVIRRLKAEVKRLREEIKFLKSETGETGEISKDECDNLKQCVDAFVRCNDDVELDMGPLTLTKIHTVFRIFKQMISNCRDATLSYCDGITGDEGNYDHEGQIRYLKKILAQRDEEVKILAETVKNNQMIGKTEENKADTRTYSKLVPMSSIKVCGVDRCADWSIISEPSKAFDWFRERHPGEKSLHENKVLLQRKFQDAKLAGDTIRAAKDLINKQKSRIESIRRQKAIDQIAKGLEYNELHPDEVESLSIIEAQKKNYQSAFGTLRELKGSIEHLKQLMETNRRKLQNDFDTWYAQMFDTCDAQATHVTDVTVSEPKQIDKRKYDRDSSEIRAPSTIHASARSVEQETDTLLPNGIKLTGNKEADDDIIAFYKAKEILIARSRTDKR